MGFESMLVRMRVAHGAAYTASVVDARWELHPRNGAMDGWKE